MAETAPTEIQLLAPFAGIVTPLNEVPDPAFAQKMVGDGMAVDPVQNVLHAPCDAVVHQIHPSRHAVTLMADGDVELLVHIGVDTVKLRGDGFQALVPAGQAVKAGTPLIEFDLDAVGQKAKSLRTVVLLTQMDRIVSLEPTDQVHLNAGDLLFKALVKAGSGEAIDAEGMAASSPVTIINPTGLHARPAAAIVALAKRFQSRIMIEKDGQRVDARSLVAIMGLDIGLGDAVSVLAKGDDQAQAIEALEAAIASGLGEAGVDRNAALKRNDVDFDSEPSLLVKKSDDPSRLGGVEASPGKAQGTLYQIRAGLPEPTATAKSVAEELFQLDQAIVTAKQTLSDLVGALRDKQMGQKADIFSAHQELLDDPFVYNVAVDTVKQGESAAFAWNAAIGRQAEQLAAMNNALLAGRAADLRDVGNRVARIMAGLPQETIPKDLPPNIILVTRDLTPSDTATLDPRQVAGICTTLGGASSHSAILARSMGIPALSGVDPRILEQENGTPAVLDTSRGYLLLQPSSAVLEEIQKEQQEQSEKRARALAAKDQPAVTQDGVTIEIAGNIGNIAEARSVVEFGGEAVGLFRSEFLYQGMAAAPGEAQQTEAYKAVLETLGDRPVIVRTLDVGGDKPLPYLPLPKEENPFLGERGIRIGLDKPALLAQQLRALLKASSAGRLRIMFPMVSSLFELNLAKKLLQREAQALSIGTEMIQVGIMIEVPSAAVMADLLADHVDFFSIGTNDLTQYVLAIDRGHPKLASFADGLHPAVLRLIEMTVNAAHAKGKWVGICGGLAGEREAVPVLVGLGVDELSVSVPIIPEVKSWVRQLNRSDCRQLAEQAMNCSDAAKVRELVRAFIR